MTDTIKIQLPFTHEKLAALHAGQKVLLSGTIYTARDQAHKRLAVTLLEKRHPPFNVKGSVVYYCGPSATPPGKAVGSCGPTTSSRMDVFTPLLLQGGMSAAIGKGKRSLSVTRGFQKHKAVYFLTYAGCGALLSRYVKKKNLTAYPDLGPEAIYAFEVEDFPLIVCIDTHGRSIYDKG
ncbi:MAG: FumA C-terminus/TtdB family hydratase beta subunit [Candidatus Omnitrophica bacterium]|nr:FumA C-terminus/TtdB family hydratase beta subunit [Candidatus Omnitrophota bacterium]